MSQAELGRRSFVGFASLTAAAVTASRALVAGEAAASNEIVCDVAIVGAGLSGLRAAMALDARGVEVAVLEARDRVGGRLLTVQPHPEDTSVFIDHGGQWVSVGQERLTALAGELGVALFPTWGGGGTVDWRKGHRSTYSGQFPKYWSSDDEAQTLAAVDKLESMAKTVPLDTPWTAPDAAYWDFQPFSEWVAAKTDRGQAQSDAALAIFVLVLASIVGALLTIASALAIREGPLRRAETLWVAATRENFANGSGRAYSVSSTSRWSITSPLPAYSPRESVLISSSALAIEVSVVDGHG
jgi:hypothetical protein